MKEMLLIDLSAWRDYIKQAEFVKMAGAGCQGLLTRVTLGEGYIDPTARPFMRWADALGWVINGYHWLTPHLPGQDPTEAGQEQAIHYLAAAFALPHIDFHWLDVEQPGIEWETVLGYVEYMRRMGYKVGLYTRDSYWNPQPPYKARFNYKPGIFDQYWFADYRGGRRFLYQRSVWKGNKADWVEKENIPQNIGWETTANDESWRPTVLIGGIPTGHMVWQTGLLRYEWKGKWRAIGCNIAPFPSQREMLLVGRG